MFWLSVFSLFCFTDCWPLMGPKGRERLGGGLTSTCMRCQWLYFTWRESNWSEAGASFTKSRWSGKREYQICSFELHSFEASSRVTSTDLIVVWVEVEFEFVNMGQIIWLIRIYILSVLKTTKMKYNLRYRRRMRVFSNRNSDASGAEFLFLERETTIKLANMFLLGVYPLLIQWNWRTVSKHRLRNNFSIKRRN